MQYTHPHIESLLQAFRESLGKDYEKYRNHVYRVFLNCLLIDADKSNEEKYAIAAVYHDIGIWTKHTIDYLAPSISEATAYLKNNGKTGWTEEIETMIYWHHKIKKYKGIHQITTEAFRKADWIDVSLGFIKYGVDRKMIKMNRQQFPNKGFHFFLVKKIVKNFFRHPLHPLPMFKK
jgi:hypothetical protein